MAARHVFMEELMPLKGEDRADVDEERDEYFAEQMDVSGPSVGPTESGSEGGELEIFGARVLWLDGPRLTFEFEVPAAGFMLPYDGAVVQVCFSDGTVRNAIVLGEESSPQGPHQPGLTIRMVLELEDRYSWQHQEVQISWHTLGFGTVNLHLAIG